MFLVCAVGEAVILEAEKFSKSLIYNDSRFVNMVLEVLKNVCGGSLGRDRRLRNFVCSWDGHAFTPAVAGVKACDSG